MADNPCIAIGRVSTSGKQILVRAAPGVEQPYIGAIPLQMGGYEVVEGRDSVGGANWLRLTFVGGISGWVRADEVDIVGECSPAGYGTVAQATRASAVARAGQPAPVSLPVAPVNPVPVPVPVPIPVVAPVDTTTPAIMPADISNAVDRVRKAAFNITAGFEGGGYATYQNHDAGVISYGRFQFTLASGSLFSVVDRYLQRANGATADGLRAYAGRIQARDNTLRPDAALRALLVAAAAEPVMQTVQDEVATEVYWNRVQDLSIKPRAIVSPLGQALLFDMAINHGVFHDMLGKAEQELGVPLKSRVGENGHSEQELIARVAQIRQARMRDLATRLNAPGLIPRGDFWVAVVDRGDWNLAGDERGELEIKQGRRVQVRQPG